jgi:hypothetical protein
MFSWLAIGLVVCFSDETPTALLERVLDAQRAHLSTIRTFSCQFERRQVPNPALGQPPVHFATRYWRRDNHIRILGQRDGRPVNELYLSDRVISLGVDEKTTLSQGVVMPRRMDSLISPWMDLLIEFRGPQGIDLPLWEYVSSQNAPARLISACRQGALIVLELETKTAKRTLTADLERHGHIVEAVTRLHKPERGPAFTTAKIRQFVEYQPRKFFPTNMVLEAAGEDGSAPTILGSATISELRVNPELTDEVFSLPFPPGTRVRDFLAQKGYVVDNAGSWILDPTVRIGPDRGQQVTPTAIAQAKASVAPPPRGPSGSEPWPWSNWLIALSSVVAIAAVGFLLWRWRHEQEAR